MVTASTAAAMSRAPAQASLLRSSIGGEGVVEDHHRQAGDRLGHIPGEELVAERGEQQGRGLAADAGEGEQGAGEHAARAGAPEDGRLTTCQNGAPSATPASRRAVGCSFSTSSVVRVITGTAMQCQGDRTGEAGEAVERPDQELVDEQADQDRRRREQHVVQEADRRAVAARSRIFGQPGARQHADDDGDHHRQGAHHDRADDRVAQAARR